MLVLELDLQVVELAGLRDYWPPPPPPVDSLRQGHQLVRYSDQVPGLLHWLEVRQVDQRRLLPKIEIANIKERKKQMRH